MGKWKNALVGVTWALVDRAGSEPKVSCTKSINHAVAKIERDNFERGRILGKAEGEAIGFKRGLADPLKQLGAQWGGNRVGKSDAYARYVDEMRERARQWEKAQETRNPEPRKISKVPELAMGYGFQSAVRAPVEDLDTVRLVVRRIAKHYDFLSVGFLAKRIPRLAEAGAWEAREAARQELDRLGFVYCYENGTYKHGADFLDKQIWRRSL